MKILPVINYTNQNSLYSKGQSKNGNNLNFKSVSTTLILLAAREGSHAIKSSKKSQYIRALSESIRDLAYCDSQTIQAIYSAIAKTPDSFYTGKGYMDSFVELFNNSMFLTPSIAALRGSALKKLNCIDDNSSYTIAAKKDFIRSVLDNGHEITKEFYNQFEILDDSLYKNLKEEIIDSCFYSRKYNSSRHYAGYSYPLASSIDGSHGSGIFDGYSRNRENIFNEQLYNNLVLLSSLDKQEYATYIKKNRNIIEQAKQRLEKFLRYVDNSNLVHYYNYNIKSI
ncbi:TPA: hypothetical protein CPT90_01185 [Candidatus Gastranaerophilales bacterium HUM_3]|jgi:hypothetical protein|nr:MAG TPA: hypothetical protein CPT99_08940 [Candidatus Gastranaerophilales bacterium HUM_4]DAA87510.1 MAG TPA: hypothetical protein CPT90_01185 [Candidatus Gastranaerophilales bacterium HUM_3]DAA88255.1 MAG TPA: hypothetical protein CPT87_11395 [Candidatus Gastranaerophilales bacterium HUM_5]DAB21248.1 MAG TPA: hypothetical protein CPT94_08190 [Candidatus Gastranaerophilales bacterium HUM_22]